MDARQMKEARGMIIAGLAALFHAADRACGNRTSLTIAFDAAEKFMAIAEERGLIPPSPGDENVG